MNGIVQTYVISDNDDLSIWGSIFSDCGLNIRRIDSPQAFLDAEHIQSADIVLINMGVEVNWQHFFFLDFALLTYFKKPVVIISNKYSREIEEHAQQNGASGYLHRDWHEAILLEALLLIISGASVFVNDRGVVLT